MGPLQVRQHGAPVAIPGAKPRAILTMLGLHNGSVVSADTLVELLWGENPPRTAGKALQTHISLLRRTLGDGFVLTEGAGWTLAASEVDASRYKSAARQGRDAAAAGDTGQAVARFEEALALWRGIPELPDSRRGTSEKTRWIEGHAALVEDRADALLATGRAAEIIGELEAAVADAPLRERRWGQLMLALYRAGRQGEALGAYQRARTLLADELGVDPGPNLRRLEAAIVAQDTALETPVAQHSSAITRAVTFLLTDIEGSTVAWEADAGAMAVALARHDELVEQVVTSRGGRLIKTRGEGDATFSVFERPSAGAAAAIELQDAIVHEPWALREPMRIRVALHTGEAELRDGDYFGRAVNRAARLRSLAAGGQILCSGATAELVVDSLPDDVVLADLGMRQLKNLARPEHVFELRMDTAEVGAPAPTSDEPLGRPDLPGVLGGPGPFVGRGRELGRLFSAWQSVLAGGASAVLIAGEPGVGKTRLAGEWSRQAYDHGALVIYGRCDEDLGAPYQPFAEALRSLVPCLGTTRLRGLRGVEALLPMVPGLTDVMPDLATPTRADPDTERYALFDAVVAVLGVASASAPVVLVLDDLHWAAKPTLLLLRHILRFAEQDRVQIVGTYRSTDLDRSHPLAAMLADLHRDGTADRLQLSGLDEGDVTAYVAEAGYDDEELARALASVTGGNPFFLIEALRHVEESGGHWDPSTLPQGVREAVSRRLSRLPAETNKALAAAAVVGSRFAVDLVEHVVGDDLVDAFDQACKAGIIIEESGGHYRFNHAIVRQSLLAELPSVRRMRLHQRIAATLENQPGADDELLAELAHHYFECAWAGNAAKAVEYCRRAADQAMTRLAYEGAADLYDRALHALEEIDEELPDRDDQVAALLIARCEALLAAGDVTSAAGAVAQLQEATRDSARLAAWATCFDGQLSMLIHPERLDEVETAVGSAAGKLAELDDAAGEAMAHTVRAGCLARLGRIGDCEIALDDALTAARRAREHRRVNAVLAGAPLAALWGPNPVPRAGGRCLDVVRLLRITTDSPAVEATSTRCQAVLEAFRGRAAAARRMIDSARRTVTELGLRHALLEVEQFAGIVELVVDDPAAAEAHLRQAYNGFRRMGLDADTAETAALLGRTCLALDRDAEADELCTESERLAGHALKPSIAWRALRAHLLSRGNDHEGARRVAEAAVSLAERTDLLVDHGDACASLATVLGAAGDAAGARAAAERAVGLYERKGAAALVEKARGIAGATDVRQSPQSAPAPVEPTNACVQAGSRLIDAVNREAWDEVAQLLAPSVSVESRRKIVGFSRIDVPKNKWPQDMRRYLETGMVRYRHTALAVRGQRLALMRLEIATVDLSSGAPRDEMLQVVGLDEEGQIALQVKFDVEDIDAALAELDATHARFEEECPRDRLESAASRADARFNALFAERRWDEIGALLADDLRVDDRRRGLRREGNDRATELSELRTIADLGTKAMTSDVIAIRGERLALVRTLYTGRDQRPEAFHTEVLRIAEIDTDERIVAYVAFDPDDVDAAYEELEARYLTGDAAPYAHVWQIGMETLGELNRHESGRMIAGLVYTDHRHVGFAPGDFGRAVEELWALVPDARYRTAAVHALDAHGTVVKFVIEGTDVHGNELQWPRVLLLSVGREETRLEVYEEDDVDAALARFEELRPQARRLENAASQITERLQAHFAARDWAALTDMLADDVFSDDRRRVVNAGIRRGRDAAIRDARANSDLGVRDITSTVIATRGERLVLRLARYSGEASHIDLFSVFEIGDDDRVVARVVFDPDDFDAAIAELDARYLAGEAAAHARTWSVIVDNYAALNRHELPAMTPDCVSIDHRRGTAFAPGEVIAYARAALDHDHNIRNHVEAVHLLNDLGVFYTHVGHETSQEGFDAEWRIAFICTVQGGMVNRCELFDEADLDTAIARFEQLSRPAPRLENAAIRAAERYFAHYAARDWDAMTGIVADDFSIEDRRRVVNAGIQYGRDAGIAGAQATADVGFTLTMLGVMATRGEHLALLRVRAAGPDPGAIQNDALNLVEVDADGRTAAVVVFDLDDFEAAIAELDARYLTGEAAAHARSWSVVVRSYAAANRQPLTQLAPDYVSIDHRRARAFAPGEIKAYMHATWNLAPEVRVYIEAVHQLSDFGAVVTHAANGSSQQGFEAEWREVNLSTVDGDLINRCELFDEADVDTALARFDQLSRPAPRLENAASQAVDRYSAHFAARDWDALAEVLADDIVIDDRRRVVNAGIRHGRDAEIANLRATADAGFTYLTFVVMAARGERLILARASGRDTGSEEFESDALGVAEINSDNQIAAIVVFDLDNFEAAIAELDDRYLAGEAAAHARMWSRIMAGHAALNRQELPPITPDCVSIDHRRGTAFAPGELAEYLRAGWDLKQEIRNYVEVVHRLSDLGAVWTDVGQGVSDEGFDAEWRTVDIMTVEGDMVNRCEIFEEADLDAALAKFDQLSRPVPRLENAASQLYERCNACFVAHDWDALAETFADDISTDDRRRVVGIAALRGRDTVVANGRAIVDFAMTNVTATVVAIRGERLILARARFTGPDQGPGAFHTDILAVLESDADNRIAAHIVFDPDDFDAALAELDARYLAGEAAAHSRTWSLVTSAFAAINRHELPELTPDWVNVDHRHGAAFAPGDMTAYVHDLFEDAPDIDVYIEAVHRLDNLGVVVTQRAHGTSQQGFEAEWREIGIFMFDGDLLSRFELFDEADLAAALARFEQLSRPAARLENAASRVYERFMATFAARDWDAMAQLLANDTSTDDRRRVVNSGIQDGREANIATMRAFADLGVMNMTSEVIATRGECLALSRVGSAAFQTYVLNIVEIGADELIVAVVGLDVGDIDAAFAELDARYLAGEAAAHAHTWSAITRAYAAINRRELPATTPDWVTVDHRPLPTFELGDLPAFLSVTWDLTPQASIYVEAVHRLNNLGGVVTHAVHGTSRQGFDAEWRMIQVLTVAGDRINRVEVFEEPDIDAALARFEELHRSTPQLENAASQAGERYLANFAAGDWDAMAEIMADNFFTDDRRRVVGAGVRHGRDAQIADMRVIANLSIMNVTSTVIAIRGDRLGLLRSRFSNRDPGSEAFLTDVLAIVEINADERIIVVVSFDSDDIDAAIAELDARYVAGEAAAYSQAWSVIAGAFAAFNRHELPAATPGAVNIDHRPLVAIEAGDLPAYLRAAWEDLTPQATVYIEAVHRLSNLGAVVTHAGHGISHEGFDAEWRMVDVFTVDGKLISRCELFDEADIDAAIVRFDELSRQPHRLENAASRVDERFAACFGARDWDAMAELMVDDISIDDRRHVVNAGLRCGRDVEIENLRARAGTGVAEVTPAVIATRGERLALSRTRFSGRDERPDAFHTEALTIIEIDADQWIVARVGFDPDDFDAAFAELDARYLAGEAAAHAHTWSLMAEIHATLNRHEIPRTTPDWVNIDHQRGIAFAPGEIVPFVRATFDDTPDVRHHIVGVHRLSDLGAVITQALHGTSEQGLEAEWQNVGLFTFAGELGSRVEIFDEEDLDTALARFDELHPQAQRLENAASRANERLVSYYAARDWEAATEALADDFYSDDRRHVVNVGLQHGRDVAIANMKTSADLRIMFGKPDVIATRGERLVLSRSRWSGPDQRPQAFHTETLAVVEVNADERVAARMMFDANDIDAAFAELDARYLAGEAAAHAHTWSAITGTYTAFNRHDLTVADWAVIDHRRGALFAVSNMTASVRAFWDQTPDLNIRIEAAHRVSAFGAVVTHTAYGTSPEGFDAEWRMIQVLTVQGDRIDRCEIFDETDIDAALARFEELQPHAPRLENAASRVYERFSACSLARNWDVVAQMLADNIFNDDRRRVVNAGLRHGRDATIASMQASAALGLSAIASTVIATRGERLVLNRERFSIRDQGSDEIVAEVLGIVEIDADERIVTRLAFDLDDIGAAFVELDARYLAGEAAEHAHTWSVITEVYAAYKRHELPAADWVNVDHRRGTPFATSDLTAVIRAWRDVTPDFTMHIDAVHRLNEFGAVITHTSHGTAQEGFAAEWRMIQVLTVEGDRINRCEMFDEEDLNAALARFEELRPHAPRLENTASRVEERFRACFVARDWVAMAEILADDTLMDDRRRVIGIGVRRGRDVQMADMTGGAKLDITSQTSSVIATRGERLVLSRGRFGGRDRRPEAFYSELLNVAEIDSDERIVARIMFDLDDLDAAFEELDARYLAGEAAAHAHTWSVIAESCAAFNRHELPAADMVTIDHRQLAILKATDPQGFIGTIWDVTPDFHTHIEAVHRLSSFGAVATYTAYGTSEEGVDAEWRVIQLVTVEGGRITHCEIFDEEDIDAALARFEELHPQTPQLENAASRAEDRFFAYYKARDWTAIAEILTDGSFIENRTPVVSSGFWEGRDVVIANMQALAEAVANSTSAVVAIRGECLALTRHRFPNSDARYGEFVTEQLIIAEIDTDDRIAAHIVIDPDDMDAAIAELDARYLAGEAAAHAHTWSLMAQTHATLNRHEIPPTTPDWVNIDHRRGIAFAPGDIVPFVRATFDDTPDLSDQIVAVHRLSALGAVITQAIRGTSGQGRDAEWQNVGLFTFEGDLANRVEIFDEEDLDAALARFDDLHPQTARLKNAVSQVGERFLMHFAARDWEAMAGLLADDYSSDDRRRVVGAGVRHGRDAQIADMRAIADLWITNVKMTVIATRGERLVLTRTSFSGRDQGSEAFLSDVLNVAEIDADERYLANVSFDLDDLDAAIAELDARYLAGEAATHAHTWSVIAGTYAGFNRHEFPSMTPDSVSIDHRRLVTNEAVDLAAATRSVWDVAPNLTVHIEAVHRLSELGAVVTHVGHGTSPDGFDAEWRMVNIFTVDGDLISRCEIFDETDLGAALARFEELHPQVPCPENAASQVEQRFLSYFATRNWDAIAELITDDFSMDDRRRVVNAGVRRGRDAEVASLRAIVDVGVTSMTLSTVIAIRGARLALGCYCVSDSWGETKALCVVEINAENQIVARVGFDPDDLDAAFEELDTRYLAGEAAAHSHIWSLMKQAYAAHNRHELAPTAPDAVSIDHRRAIAFERGDIIPYLRATWDLAPNVKLYIAAAHRLTDLGAVITQFASGTSQEGFAAEWREIALFTFDGDLISRCEIFDEADLAAALARFDELKPQAPRLENKASRVWESFQAANDRARRLAMTAEDIFTDDRRPIVGAGVQRGRDVNAADMRAVVDIGFDNMTSTVIATRGERLVLDRFRLSGRDQAPEPFYTELLRILEIDADNRLAACIAFALDDIDAAFEELEARYLAGEAAAHAHIWSLTARNYGILNRHELPRTTPNLVSIDHRRGIAFEPGDVITYTGATWDVAPDAKLYIEAVHRLTNIGAVVTHTAHGTSQEGFDAEWREIVLFAFEGDLGSRCEIFDEADLDAALARFDELQPRARQLENVASRVSERLWVHFLAGDWDAMAAMLADNYFTDDRRRVVGVGVRHGRDGWIADMRATADLWTANATSTVVATRGQRLVLMRGRFTHRDQTPEGFLTEFLSIVEIDADERIATIVMIDSDDTDAAFEELDARYLAGEAAAHSHAWSVISRLYAGFNRQKLPATTTDWTYLDHRSVISIEADDLPAFISAGWELTPEIGIYMEAVHRLSDLGAVVTHTARGISSDNFEAEWRMIDIFTVDGDLISRCEMFDEADLDAALARFDELQPQAPLLENAATRSWTRQADAFNRRDLDDFLALITVDGRVEDRRKGLRALFEGSARRIAAQAMFEAPRGWRLDVKPIAVRGARLALTRTCWRDTAAADRPVTIELLAITEVGDGDLVRNTVSFDPDDIDAAFEELEARYLAGEAAAYSRAWTAMTQVQTVYNRHEVPPTTKDFVDIDHRRGRAFMSGDSIPFINATWKVARDVKGHIEAVHRLSNLGAVVTEVVTGSSHEGFDFELREIGLFAFEGDLICRFELFDEADLDAACARFDELDRPAALLENAATRIWARSVDAFNRRDVAGYLGLMTADGRLEDRRKGLGLLCEGATRQQAVLGFLEPPESWHLSTEPIAIRGSRLSLTRDTCRDTGEPDQPVTIEVLTVMEVGDGNLIRDTVSFDPDDINGAFAELTARWIASGEVAHPEVIESALRLTESLNRHDWDAFATLTDGAAYVNHRQLASPGADTTADYLSTIRMGASLVPDFWVELAEVHTHSAIGLVAHQVVKGTSTDGVAIELPLIQLILVDGDRVTRIEAFDPAQRDLALARFEELNRPG